MTMNNDLISRSALTDAIVDLLVFEWGYEGIEESVKRIFSEAPAVDAGPMWISVEDRLPNPNTTVLVIWHRAEKEQRIGFGRWQQHGVWYVSNEGMPKVTHWMPLPEVPHG